MSKSANTQEESRAHVSLPAEMRPLLDRAQKVLGVTSWSSAVQTLLQNLVAADGEEGVSLEGEQLLREMGKASSEALDRLAEALNTVFDAADLDVDEGLVTEAVHALAANSNPVAASRFALNLYREIQGQRQGMERVMTRMEAVEEALKKTEQALLQQPSPQIVVENAAADADADAGED